MEKLAGRDRFTDCSYVAGRLLAAAIEFERNAAACRRAAARYLEGRHAAIADTRREVDGEAVTILEMVGRSHRAAS